MSDSSFEVIIVGGGPAGYVAAIRAAQLGFTVACIEKEPKLGGTCLRVGCIPSKTLLDASEKFAQLNPAQNHYAQLGIKVTPPQMDVPTLMQRKTKVIDQLSGGISFLFKKNKITHILGTARFLDAQRLEVLSSDGSKQVVSLAGASGNGKKGGIIIATGSVPVELPFLKFDGQKVINSDQAIALNQVPGKMIVVGAGAIGLELGSVWSRLGTKVTVLEMFPQILAGGGGADEEMAKGLERALKKQGLNFYLGAKLTGATPKGSGMEAKFEWEGKTLAEEADVILVAVGRKPFTDGLGLKDIKVELDPRGRIVVDGRYQTTVPGVYAIGDVIAGPMLAHKAEDEGVACVEMLAGKYGHVNYDVIPGVVYTAPELAWVGLTEQQAQERQGKTGHAYAVGKFRFAVNSRAVCVDETEGLVKIIADAKTDKVLGIHIFGPQAGTLIGEAVLAMEFGASSEDIARTCHAHPTLSEALKEAALAVDKRSIHGA